MIRQKRPKIVIKLAETFCKHLLEVKEHNRMQDHQLIESSMTDHRWELSSMRLSDKTAISKTSASKTKQNH